jgi:pyruvate-formate lyase-activating enzyme
VLRVGTRNLHGPALAGAVHASPCCPAPRRVPAPVDLLLPDAGLRLRHLPGEVCLSCREVSAPPAEPNPALAASLARCLQGDPAELVLVKARPAGGPDPEESCPLCGGPLEAALLDVALGEGARLVVEALPGGWCWACESGRPSGGRAEVTGRLSRFALPASGPVVPSLVYDTPGHPRSVQMEVTTRCNLSCPYCSHRELDDKRDLPLGRFQEMTERIDFSRVDNVDFTGLGEPAMHRDLPAMVREVLRRGRPTHVRVVTNGTVMIPKRYEPLCEAGVTSIAFSIDSLDPEAFARSRVGARLDQVLQNLESLVAFRDRRGLTAPRIKIKAVLIDDPWNEAERLLAYSARLGIEMPHFSCLDARSEAAVLYEQPWLRSDWAETGGGDLMSWAEARWRELGGAPVETAPAEPTPADRAAGFHHPLLLPSADLCRWAVDAAFVAWGGGCLSCCEQMIDLPRHTFGDLAGAEDSSLEALWRGDLLWGYRLPLALGLLPRGCVGCPKAPAGGRSMESLTAAPRSGHTSPPA